MKVGIETLDFCSLHDAVFLFPPTHMNTIPVVSIRVLNRSSRPCVWKECVGGCWERVIIIIIIKCKLSKQV